MKATKEIALEEAILAGLTEQGGYTLGQNTNYDPAHALDTAELFTFIGATQNDEWERLIALRGNDPDLAQLKFVERLAKRSTSAAPLRSCGTASTTWASMSAWRSFGRYPG